MDWLIHFQSSPDGATVALAGLAVLLGYWVWSAVRWTISRLR